MASPRATLINYFLTGKKPTQEQFTDFINSVYNLNDDTFQLADVEGLDTALNGKASTDSVNALNDAVTFLQSYTLPEGVSSINIPARTIVEKIWVITGATAIDVIAGSSNGNNDFLESTHVLANDYYIVSKDIPFANVGTIYFGGLAADSIVIIYKR
jgi:hypothetical protein